MSEPAQQTGPRTAFTAPVVVLLGLVVAIGAWLLPVNLTSVSPALLRAAGRDTPTLGAYGRDLVDLEKIGPASLVLAAARDTRDPRVPALADALREFEQREPALVAWGGWDPFLDPLFNLRAKSGHDASTPVLTFFIPAKARDALRAYLAKSGSEGVQDLLKLRDLGATGRFVPANRPGGQPLDALILLAGLLYQGEHLSPSLQRELRGMADTALAKNDLGDLEPFFMDLLALGRRLDWTQMAELLRRTDSVKTVGEYAHLARVAPAQLPLIYAAALFSDSSDRVASYLIQYGSAGLQDLTLALGYGQGAVKLLLLHQVPVNRTTGASIGVATELALTHPQLVLALKYLGYLIGVWLVLRGLDRWLIAPGNVPGVAVRMGHMRSGLLAFLFAVLLVVVSEPFLLRAAPASEFQFGRTVLAISNSPISPQSQPGQSPMDESNLITIGVFAALQIAMYFACLLKIRDIARQPLSPLIKLRLMENEENLFDGGLYVGIFGTATALVLQVLRIIEPNLLAAYSSNMFGITCVALVKIRHVRAYKRQLILEGQIAATPVREPSEPSLSSGQSSAAL
ncbi:MAG TPA: hypothetical protein VHE61_03210 [Opitutaceae bacterium]|nr:hypothetical protein [Opitutaceae bacterium]